MDTMRCAGRLPMVAIPLALALALPGCFGSEYLAEGESGKASEVMLGDVAGVGLIAWSAQLLQDQSDSSDDPLAFYSRMAAMLPAGLGVAAIIGSETSYGRYKRHQAASYRLEGLRRNYGARGGILPRERLSTMSADQIERYEGEARLQISNPAYLQHLRTMRTTGWCLAAGGYLLMQASTMSGDLDEETPPGGEALQTAGSCCLLAGALTLVYVENKLRNVRTQVFVAPNGFGVACRF